VGELLDSAVTLDRAYVMQTYARKPVLFVRGEGMRLYDDEGREYLDFVSGIGAVNLGHAHPAVASALCDQASRLLHVSNLFYTEHRGELAEKVAGLLAANGGSEARDWRLFFANSGTEASEGAIKLARRWAGAHKPGAHTVVTAERSFHGRTLAALAATGQPSKQEAFAPLPAGFVHVPLNDIAALDAVVDGTVAAVFLEVVQGEGGVWPCSVAYLEAARRICDERNCLLMLDEVQTGFFRTGPAFAFQSFGITPDVVTLAKGMANGVPIGAVAGRGSAASALIPGDHGSTFGGGPLATAAGLATVDALVDERVGENALAVGEYLRTGLRGVADSSGAIGDVRGAGLMVGATLKNPIAADVAVEALARGVVLNNIGADIVRLLPPLVCSHAEVDTLLKVLSDILSEGEQ
jgi:acetylornithine/N-succinyldiaminopimelate aminotransferase